VVGGEGELDDCGELGGLSADIDINIPIFNEQEYLVYNCTADLDNMLRWCD